MPSRMEGTPRSIAVLEFYLRSLECDVLYRGDSATGRASDSLSAAENARMPPMAAESFQVAGRAGTNASVYILSVKGAITYANSPALQEAVSASAAPGLILDLSEVPSVDSMAIGALVRIFVSCNKSGRKLALAGLNLRIKNVLQLTGVDPLFDTYSTISEAESALNRSVLSS